MFRDRRQSSFFGYCNDDNSTAEKTENFGYAASTFGQIPNFGGQIKQEVPTQRRESKNKLNIFGLGGGQRSAEPSQNKDVINDQDSASWNPTPQFNQPQKESPQFGVHAFGNNPRRSFKGIDSLTPINENDSEPDNRFRNANTNEVVAFKEIKLDQINPENSFNRPQFNPPNENNDYSQLSCTSSQSYLPSQKSDIQNLQAFIDRNERQMKDRYKNAV